MNLLKKEIRFPHVVLSLVILIIIYLYGLQAQNVLFRISYVVLAIIAVIGALERARGRLYHVLPVIGVLAIISGFYSYLTENIGLLPLILVVIGIFVFALYLYILAKNRKEDGKSD